jgi:glycogen debranching enzyme
MDAVDRRAALVIACTEFEDKHLQELTSPRQDATALADVLSNPHLGGFEVEVILNPTSHAARVRIEAFYTDRKKDDLLLLYFSGHGIKDDSGQLYLATPDTQRRLLRATSVPASFVNEAMNASFSRRQVLILDCCNSGAFAKGLVSKGSLDLNLREQFQGTGRVVLTASNAVQFAFEGEDSGGRAASSVFTRHLVAGIRTGDADTDGDGWVSLDELYDYVHARVIDDIPHQEPSKWVFNLNGNLFISQSPQGPRPQSDPSYVVVTSPVGDRHPFLLKHGDTFGLFNHFGDISPGGIGEEGLYDQGTRFLSCLKLKLDKGGPLLLHSVLEEDGLQMTADLMNADHCENGRVIVPRGALHISRSKCVYRGACYESLRFRNYSLAPVDLSFTVSFEADYADLFEVRGTRRARRGQLRPVEVETGSVVLSYLGLDGVLRRTRLTFTPAPDHLSGAEARFRAVLPPQAEARYDVTVCCESREQAVPIFDFNKALNILAASRETDRAGESRFQTSNEQYNAWLGRSVADLRTLVTETPEGPFPYAGAPWSCGPFGRQGIIAALECLSFAPDIARGVLGYLASTQAKEVLPEQRAEPGKILFQTQQGEMAALGEIPFARDYGSVDTTPLFVILAGAYYERTADREFVSKIWPSVALALRWCDTCGDRDGDGFIEYMHHLQPGPAQEGWKESQDSVFHADGTPATPPIALCEAQGYLYAAKGAGAALAAVLGHAEQAATLFRQADALRDQFERAFWCDDIGTYALALDGQKRPCRVRSSNAGHCLFTGIASPEHARRTAQTLLNHQSYSGWGIRTVAAAEARYNPMSYHNGCVWPHDNALIAAGMARYGLKGSVSGIMTGMFEAIQFLDLHRLPELFCGFTRRPGQGPTLYPVARGIQAWTAASVFLLLQSCLGLTVNAPEAQISFAYPLLPTFLKEVQIRGLKVGGASIDLLLLRHEHDVGINVLRREGRVQVGMIK